MHLSTPRDGVPSLLDTPELINEAIAALASGTGPIAVDTERASAYRFDDRAYVIQLRRPGAGTFLVDPTVSGSANDALGELMNSCPWILHAAHTDLPALTTLGWAPTQLHDTQIAGRLLGMGQPGLSRMLEDFLDVTIDKDKGREDWSARPLERDLLNYAALDVELLQELLDAALEQLRDLGREEWYAQDCAATLQAARPIAFPSWRDLKGLGTLRSPRSVAIARELAQTRIDWALARDRSPESGLSSKNIVEISRYPRESRSILDRARMARSLSKQAHKALQTAWDIPEDKLPAPLERKHDPLGHPDYRTWPSDFPRADQALNILQLAVDELCAELKLTREALAVSKQLRAAAWAISQVELSESSETADPLGEIEWAFGSVLEATGARPWQRDLLLDAALPKITEAIF